MFGGFSGHCQKLLYTSGAKPVWIKKHFWINCSEWSWAFSCWVVIGIPVKKRSYMLHKLRGVIYTPDDWTKICLITPLSHLMCSVWSRWLNYRKMKRLCLATAFKPCEVLHILSLWNHIVLLRFYVRLKEIGIFSKKYAEVGRVAKNCSQAWLQ